MQSALAGMQGISVQHAPPTNGILCQSMINKQCSLLSWPLNCMCMYTPGHRDIHYRSLCDCPFEEAVQATIHQPNSYSTPVHVPIYTCMYHQYSTYLYRHIYMYAHASMKCQVLLTCIFCLQQLGTGLPNLLPVPLPS